jgi:hypothetical protein
MPLSQAPFPPPFPVSGYNASAKRTWTPDAYCASSGGSGGVMILGQAVLTPFYIRYDVPAGGLEMKASYYANGFSQSGLSNVCQWAIYRVGTSVYDSTLVESLSVSDVTNYTNQFKTQTMTLAYPKGWYIAFVVVTSGTCQSSTTNLTAQMQEIIGNTTITTNIIRKDTSGVAGIAGLTSTLPSNLNSVTIISNNSYGIPVNLRY